jgi:hypothetical protein
VEVEVKEKEYQKCFVDNIKFPSGVKYFYRLKMISKLLIGFINLLIFDWCDLAYFMKNIIVLQS